MLKIGLTGGICCGKSMVSKYFTSLSVPVLDADKIAHDLTEPENSCHGKIINHFGKSFLNPDGTLHRKKIRSIIFTDETERRWLEDLLHPRIRAAMLAMMKTIAAPYVILAIPLLLETRYTIKTDRILLVDCTLANQIKRLTQRDRETRQLAKRIVQSQAKRALRLEIADDIIYNNGSTILLQKTINFLHNYYLSIAKKYDTMLQL